MRKDINSLQFFNFYWFICGNYLYRDLGTAYSRTSMVGRPFIHFGNTLTAVAILYLGYRNGMIAGIIGLGGFDLLNGYAATSWLTMLEVVVCSNGFNRCLSRDELSRLQEEHHYFRYHCWGDENFYYLLCFNCRSTDGGN